MSSKTEDVAPQKQFVLGTHDATIFNLTFLSCLFGADGILFFLELNLPSKMLPFDNFTVDG